MRIERILGVMVLACGLAAAGTARADNGECSEKEAVKVSSDCQGIGWEGCCKDGQVVWCEQDGTALCALPCTTEYPCGWLGQLDLGGGFIVDVNSYVCGGEGAEPTGTYPLDCAYTCSASCQDKQCGTDGCFGSCGDCAAPTPECVAATGLCAACAPDCWGKKCGDDGCGGTCGTCDTDAVCIVTDEDTGASECCTPACDGKVCGPDGCGGTCGACTDTQYCADDQSACIDCTCTGKDCGQDGCGNPCGTCAGGKGCSDAGLCVDAPAHCSDNPAGGCGGCACESCVCAMDPVCCEPAGADGDGWDWICAWECQSDCGGEACPCVPDCTDRVCGDDGCDGTCGTCKGAGEVCTSEGTCCVPSCDGKACGDDGCGGQCGTCAEDKVCQEGQCVACEPQCDGKACGDDGCGGECGTCGEGLLCNATGQCVGATYPDSCLGLDTPSADSCDDALTIFGCCDTQGRVIWCDGGKLYCIDCPVNPTPESQTCGWAESEDFTGYDCGNVGEDPSGTNPLECGFCAPSCTGKECGDDGCGGSCGTCTGGEACTAGQCVPPTGDVIEPDVVTGDTAGTDTAGTDTTAPADVPAQDTTTPGDTAGTDRGSDTTVADTGRDTATTDTIPGTDTTTGKKDGGGCTAGTGAPALPFALLLSLPGLAILARRRRG